MGLPEEERKKETDSLFKEIIDENFPNKRKKLDLQIQEAKRTPNYLNTRPFPRHIILKLSKVL